MLQFEFTELKICLGLLLKLIYLLHNGKIMDTSIIIFYKYILIYHL